MEQTNFVTAVFPAKLEYRARMEAARRKISRSELVHLAVDDYLKRLEAEPAPSASKEVNSAFQDNHR